MPLRRARSTAPSSAASSIPEPPPSTVRSNSGPTTAASSSTPVVAASSRARRWLTTSRTASGLPSSSGGRVSRAWPSATTSAPVSTSARHSSITRKALPWVRSWIAAARTGRSGPRSPPGRPLDQLADLGAREAGQPQRHDALGAAQVDQRRRRARPACPPRGRGTWRRAACGRRRRRGRGGAAAAASACPTSARPRARRSSGRRREAFTSSSATAWWRRWRSVS